MFIREAAQEDDDILVRHYRAIWESYAIDDVNIRADAESTVRDFIRDGWQHFQMAAFLAELDGKVVGSVACQLQQLPYPDVVVPAFRQHGYFWSVFVEAAPPTGCCPRSGYPGSRIPALDRLYQSRAAFLSCRRSTLSTDRF